MTDRTDRPSGIPGMAGEPFRAAAESSARDEAQATAPLGDRHPTVPLADVQPTARLDDVADRAAADGADPAVGADPADESGASPFSGVPPLERAADGSPTAPTAAEGRTPFGAEPGAEGPAAAPAWGAPADGPLPPPATDSPYDPFAAPAAQQPPAGPHAPDGRGPAQPGHDPAAAGGASAGTAPQAPAWGAPGGELVPVAPAPGWGPGQQAGPQYPGGQYPGGQYPGGQHPGGYPGAQYPGGHSGAQQPGGHPGAPGSPWATPAPAGSGVNEFGMWSLIAAGASIVGQFIPLINWFAWMLPFVGIGLGIAGLVIERYRGRRALAIWGLAVNAVLLVAIPIVVALGAFAMLAFLPALSILSS
ncbi:MAG: hypothetical protein GXX90_10205 [Microbacteriaceae bacterium]|nr:hypothetical protein [Microbacteriaceae bacterium]